MSERSTMILGGMIGAAVGVAVGFVLFTDRGRRLRAELQPEIDAVIREAVRLSQIVDDFKSGRPIAPSGATGRATGYPRRMQ